MPYDETKEMPTLILRNNPGMIRDMWIEPDPHASDKDVLVIRQIKDVQKGEASATVDIKVFRFPEPEMEALLYQLKAWEAIRRRQQEKS